jgi:hypothetical protein
MRLSRLVTPALVAVMAFTGAACGEDGSDIRAELLQELEDEGGFDAETKACIEERIEGYSDSDLETIKPEVTGSDSIEEAELSPVSQRFVGEVGLCAAGGTDGIVDQMMASIPDATDEQRACITDAVEALTPEEVTALAQGDQAGLTAAVTACVVG